MGCVKTTKQITGRDNEWQVDGVSNRVFSETNNHFKEACKIAGTPATKRQAAKFRKGWGLAFTKGVH